MSHDFSRNLIFAEKKSKNDDDVIFAGVCPKQTCPLTSGEYD